VDASGSVDGPGGGGITKYHYNFGDGTTETSPNASATHAYHDLEGQPFLCRVTVTNKKGRSDTSPPVSVEVVAEQPPLPIDCQLSDWSEWSAWIDNGDGTETRTRTRTILVEPANGGAPCDHQEETETRDIVLPPVDCVLGPEFITSETPLEACQPDGFQAVEVAWTKAIVTPPANGGLECGPMSGTRVEKRACEYVPPDPGESGPHTFFEKLSVLPACIGSWSLRDQAQIDSLDRITESNPYFTYDPASDTYPDKQDAAKFTKPKNISGSESIATNAQLDHPADVGSGDVLTSWDMYYTPTWLMGAEDGLVDAWKIFQHRQANRERWWTIINNHQQANEPGEVAETSHAAEAGQWNIPGLTNTKPLAPTGQGAVAGHSYGPFVSRWTRYWSLIEMGVDMDTDPRSASWKSMSPEAATITGVWDLISLWIADEIRDPVRLLFRVPIKFTKPLYSFADEFNTSTSAGGPGVGQNGTIIGYRRNTVMLHNYVLPVVPEEDTAIFRKPVR
jgi:hypothetical protein